MHLKLSVTLTRSWHTLSSFKNTNGVDLSIKVQNGELHQLLKLKWDIQT